jgi:hypothetical protein
MPGIRGALGVRVSDGQTDRVVTHYCRDLKFTKAAPGGHVSLDFTMILPRYLFNDLGPEDRVYVYDTRTGRTVIEGYLENPTPVDGTDGQQYDISAVGGMALASDEARSLIYITKDMTDWIAAPNASASASVEVGQWAAGSSQQRVRTQFGGGSVVATGTVAKADYPAFEPTNTELAGYSIGTIISAKTDANYSLDILTLLGTVVSGAMQTTGVSSSNYVNTGAGRLSFQLRRTGANTTVGDDTTATDWVDFSAIGRRVDRNGTALSGSSLVSTTQVLASQVVEDLLGRLLTFCEPSTAQIDVTTFGIDQLAWPDGVKAVDVLSQLSLWEPDYLWEILESFDSGKHRFNYRAWPTTPRYVISVRDGWQQRGSDVDLCNRILVTWTDAFGKPQITTVTATSAGLIDPLPGRTKDADPITLPDGFGSSVNATRIGGQILADKIDPPKAGSAVVRRPILDALTGSMVSPWEIETGYLAQVRETGDVLPITQLDYDDPSCSSALTLGRPVPTIEQRMAKLTRANPFRFWKVA